MARGRGGFGDDAKVAIQLSNQLNEAMAKIISSKKKAGNTAIITEDDFKAFKQMNAQAENLAKAMEEAGKLNLKEASSQLKELNSSLQAGIKESYEKLEKLQKKLSQKRTTAKEQAATIQAIKVLNEEIARAEADNQRRLDTQLQNIKKMAKSQSFLQQKLDGTIFDPEVSGRLVEIVDGVAKVKKNLVDFDKRIEFSANQFERMSDSINNITSADFSGALGLFKSLADSSSTFLRMKGAEQKQLTGGMKGAGIESLGKSIGTLSMVVGGFAAIFVALQGIENAQKEVNKQLLEAGGAMDMMAEGSGTVSENVKFLRETLSDGGLANELGVSLSTLQGYYSDLQGVGLTFRAFKGDLESMTSTISSLRANSAAFGVSFGDVASVAQKFREEVGLAVDDAPFMDRMGDYFTRVRDAAAQSTLSTSRFYQVIQGMADGLGTMNFKVEEAARLFVSLSKVLGPKAGEEFTQGLIGSFKGTGITDRFKTLILTKGSKKIIAQSARESVGEIAKNLDEKQKDLFKKYQIGMFADPTQLSTKEGKQKAVEALAKMKKEDFTKLLGELQAQGEGGAARARELLRQRSLAKGATGGIGAQALALDKLDMGGNFAMTMQNAMSLFGSNLSDLGAVQLEALANYTGKSMDELGQMRQIEAMMRGQLSYIDSLKGKNPEEGNEAIKAAGIQGVRFNEKGELESLSGEAITDMASFVQAQGSSLDQMVFKADTQSDLLREVVTSTLTTGEMISNTLGGLLQQIFDPLSYIATFFGSDDEDKRKNLELAATEAQARLDSATEKELALRGDMRKKEDEFQKKMEGTKDFDARMKLKESFESERLADERTLKGLGADKALLKAQVSSLRGAGKMDLAGESVDELLASASGLAVGKVAQSESGREALSEKYSSASIERGRVGEALRKRGYDYDELVGEATQKGIGGNFVNIEKKQKARQVLAYKGVTVRDDSLISSGGMLIDTLAHKINGYGQEIGEGTSTGYGDARTSEEQVTLLNDLIKTTDNPELKKRYEQEKTKIILEETAKNKKYWSVYEGAMVKAYLDSEKQKAEIGIKGQFGVNEVDFSNEQTRRDYRSRIEGIQNPSERAEMLRNIGLIEHYYKAYETTEVEDGKMSGAGLIEASKDRPVALRNGKAMLGHPMDSVSMSKGGGNNKPSVTININGGNQAEIISTVTKVLQMSGYNA